MSRVSPWLVRSWLAVGAVSLALLIAFVASSEASRRPHDVPGFTLLPLLAWGMFLHSLGRLRGSRKLRVLGLVVMSPAFPIVVYIYLRWFRLLP